MILLLAPRELAGWMSQTQTVKSAAKSAIGMAEMLAHEIKNPLAGITGAAQLLSMGLEPKDLELTDLIVEETRRIVKLLEQVEQFGNLREPIRQPVNLHDILDRVRRSALLGFGAHMTITDEYDPSLPPALGDIDQLMQVIMNLVKTQPRPARRAAPFACALIMNIRSAYADRTVWAKRYRCRSRCGMTALVCPMKLRTTSLIPLYRDVKTERVWDWRWRQKLFRTTGDGFL